MIFVLEAFFDPAEMLPALRNATSVDANVYGSDRAVDLRVRKTQKLNVPASLRDAVHAILTDAQPRLASHFDVGLDHFEEPQFLRYLPGDFFVAHQDGNTSLIHDETRHRRISVVLFVNADYSGGALTLHGRYPDWEKRDVVPAKPGSLIAFPSETTHEVTPVTAGERYTIVSWYR
ncbi:MAG TPA: 2OG-Fe(II) oxygenase [Thermoanaerobaculia bacterium]